MALVVQAEEAAQKEARRLAEDEELREHRRKLQFKVHMISTMHLLSRTSAAPDPVSCHPVCLAATCQNISPTQLVLYCVVLFVCV